MKRRRGGAGRALRWRPIRATRMTPRSGGRGMARSAQPFRRARRAATEQTTAVAEPQAVRLDGGILAATAILTSVGIVMVYSSTAALSLREAIPPLFVRHLIAIAAGVACAAVALRIPLTAWRNFALPLWGVGVALLLGTVLFGLDVNGARRWLAVPGLPLRFQPVEFAKWATVLAVAATLTAGGRRSRRGRAVLRALCLGAAPLALLLLQPDFGSAAMIAALTALLLFVVGAPLNWLALPAALTACGAALYVALRPYAMARWVGFLDPWRTSANEGFQLVQSFVAFGRGGSLGVGIGDGRQKLFYLPEAHTDFILSVVAEELGLVGVCVVLGAFAALVIAGTRIAGRARDPFEMLLAFGMTALISVPAAVNAGVVMGLLPTTGFTLPFLSFGGTSLLSCSVAIGILLRIGSHQSVATQPRVRGASPRGLVGS